MSASSAKRRAHVGRECFLLWMLLLLAASPIYSHDVRCSLTADTSAQPAKRASKKSQVVAPAVEVDLPGCSYNPDAEDHQVGFCCRPPPVGGQASPFYQIWKTRVSVRSQKVDLSSIVIQSLIAIQGDLAWWNEPSPPSFALLTLLRI